MGGRRSRGKRRAPVEPSVEVGDEVDEFVSRREEVRLGGRGLDEEESEEEVDETPVMGLEGEDGSQEDDDDDDDEEEAWKKKKLYYGGDNVDYNLMSSDEEDALEEEEHEALRLQNKEAEELEEEDFAGQDVGEDSEESAEKSDERQDEKDNIHEQATVMESVRKALGTVSDDEDKDASNSDEQSLEVFTREGLQKSAKSTLSQAEKLRIVEEKSPELIGLLAELKQSAQVLRSLSDKTDKLSQPETLFQHALINYCVNILFYLRLKSEGGDVRSHPVIGQLLEMNRQISRLKKIAAISPELLEAVSSDEERPSGAEDDGENDMDESGRELVDAVEQQSEDEDMGSTDEDEVGDTTTDLKADGDLDEFSELIEMVGDAGGRRRSARFGDVEAQAGGSRRVLKRIRMHGALNKTSHPSAEDEVLGEPAERPRVDAGRAGLDKVVEGSEADEEEEDDGVVEGAKSKKQRKLEREKKFQERRNSAHVYTYKDDADEEDRRKASREVIKNRGLTPYRSKKRRNPRIKNKLKYEDKMKRHKGVARTARTELGGSYAGELTGINMRSTKSVKY
ncbi:hypothetical protein NDN08_007264 [Rhodosorus marinus]|uniref:Sas10 C-terminal domain-containing protein n=1 Tax=Rhodosorus marinus TaxID=101924 RepID=A0AAV8UK25_9RHOD|nr:hypothetical protein NDN08_007264 [Rhodosorus marinus]